MGTIRRERKGSGRESAESFIEIRSHEALGACCPDDKNPWNPKGFGISFTLVDLLAALALS